MLWSDNQRLAALAEYELCTMFISTIQVEYAFVCDWKWCIFGPIRCDEDVLDTGLYSFVPQNKLKMFGKLTEWQIGCIFVLQMGSIDNCTGVTCSVETCDGIFIMKVSGEFGRVDFNAHGMCSYQKLANASYRSEFAGQHQLFQNWAHNYPVNVFAMNWWNWQLTKVSVAYCICMVDRRLM